MALRRFRSGSQSEPTPRDVMDSVYSLGRIFRPFGSRHSFSERANRNFDRNKPYGCVKKSAFEGGYKIERRSRSASFSSIVHDQVNMSTRRSSFSGRRPGLPAKSWSPMHSVLPGEAVGYRRMWMQGNPWPDQLSKEMGSRREGGHDYMHRMKFREPRRHYEPDFVPGGNRSDPLNLSGYGSDVLEEELLFMSGPIPAQKPDRYLPVNNFIPINRHDPLGLTQDEDDEMPLCMKYPFKPKRKRSRNKKKENVSGESSASHSQIDFADGVGNTSDTVPTEVTREASDSGTRDIGDSENLHKAVGGNSSKMQLAESEVKEACNPTIDHASETQTHGLDSVSEESAMNENLDSSEASGDVGGHSSLQSPRTICRQTSGSGQVEQKISSEEKPQSMMTFSKNSTTGSAESSMNEALAIPAEALGSVSIDDRIQPGTSGGTVIHGGEGVGVHGSSDGGDHNPVCDDRATNVDVTETHELRKRGPAPHFRSRSASLLQGKRDSESYRKLKQEYDQKLKEVQQRAQSFRSVYPVPQSPIDDEEKKHVARNRKSLKKALRIEPMKPEEQEKLIKEREQKVREFKKFWRPNMKSPEEKEGEKDPAGQQLSSRALTVDINLSPEKNPQEPPLLRGSVSRTVDSIISPVLRPEPSRICKRRRTTSECSADSASKKLSFRRSISPQNNSLPSPRKIRRQTSGSGQLEQKTESEEKPRNTVKYSKNPAYKHGNYYRYYGYRTPAMAPDFRLYHFKKEWFEGKDVLDIGCNAGDVTLSVAQYFHPQKIVGMDIDPNLIRIARQNIRSHQTKANMYQMEKYPVSTTEYGPIEPLPALTNPSNIFPKNVMFMQGNYVLKSDEELDYVKGEYDTILALSITKWIHLNHGDEGLKRMFNRMFQQLRPGGRLILEPQTWASYRRRKKLSATIYKNYNSIQLKPNDFGDYLVDTVGFCKREFLGTPFNPNKGFQRSLWLFTKYKPTTENSPSPAEAQAVSPAQYPSINERMTYLAGYSPNRGDKFPGPTTSSPSVHYGYPASDNPYAMSVAHGHFPPGYYDPWSQEGFSYENEPGARSSGGLGRRERAAGVVGGDESFNASSTPGGGGDESFNTSSSSCSTASSRSGLQGSSHGAMRNRPDQQQQSDDAEDCRDTSYESGDVENAEGAMDWQENSEDAGQLAEEDMGQLGGEDMGQLGEDMGQLGGEDMGQLGGEDMGQLGGEDMGQLGGEDMGQLGGEDIGQLGGEDMGQLGGSPNVCNGDIDHHSPASSPGVNVEDPAVQGDFYCEPVNSNESVSGGVSDDPVVGGGDFYAGVEEDDPVGVGGYDALGGDGDQDSPGGDDNQDSLLNDGNIYAPDVDEMIALEPQLDEESNLPEDAGDPEESSFPESTGDQSHAPPSEADSVQPLPPVEADQPSPVPEDSSPEVLAGQEDSSPEVLAEQEDSAPEVLVGQEDSSPEVLASHEAGLVEGSGPSGSTQRSSLQTQVGVLQETSSAVSGGSQLSSSPQRPGSLESGRSDVRTASRDSSSSASQRASSASQRAGQSSSREQVDSSSSSSFSQQAWQSSRREHPVQHPEVSSSLEGARTSSPSVVCSVPEAAGPSPRHGSSSSFSQEVAADPSHPALPESSSPQINAPSQSPQVPPEGDRSPQMSPESADPSSS